MHDPFPISPPAFLVAAVRPFFRNFNASTLHLHLHEILLATAAYHIICSRLSPWLSARLFPKIYPQLTPRTKLNWDVHVVSLVQSVFVCSVALWVLWVDNERRSMGWQERVWGYTGAGGMIQGFAAGYFLWDLGICIKHLDVFGWGLLAHAVAALSVFSFGFVSASPRPFLRSILTYSLQRPFVNYYGPTFIMYELSSPFLNLHWFFDKLKMTGSRPQWYNGMALLISFFFCRLIWGTYQSIRVYQDVWRAIHYPPQFNSTFDSSFASDGSSSATTGMWPPSTVFEPIGEADEIMRYAIAPLPCYGTTATPNTPVVPLWLAGVYLGSNIILNSLNFYWFAKMIETVQSRFREPEDVRQRRWKGGVGDHSGSGGGNSEKTEGVLVEGMADSSTVIDSVLNVEGIKWSIDDSFKADRKKTAGLASAIHVEEKTMRRR